MNLKYKGEGTATGANSTPSMGSRLGLRLRAASDVLSANGACRKRVKQVEEIGVRS